MDDTAAIGNVTRLPGVTLSIEGEVNHEVVAALEEWLEQAKSGKLTFVMLGGVRSLDGTADFQTAGLADVNVTLSLGGAMFTIAQDTWRHSIKNYRT